MEEQEILWEIDNDSPTCFVAKHYVTNGYNFHRHRNTEIYGVIRGEILVTINEETRCLRSGEMVVINGLEGHSFKVDTEAEVFCFLIGIKYRRIFDSIYGNKRLPHFLTDTQYNKKIYDSICPLFRGEEELTELKKNGLTCLILSEIVEHYGLADGEYNSKGYDLIEDLIQYIYEHYSEKMTLTSLAEHFCVTPKYLSKRISQYIGVDIRKFINDIRIQKAMQMRYDPEYRNHSLQEIGSLCGFQSMETFYKVWRRNYGDLREESDGQS